MFIESFTRHITKMSFWICLSLQIGLDSSGSCATEFSSNSLCKQCDGSFLPVNNCQRYSGKQFGSSLATNWTLRFLPVGLAVLPWYLNAKQHTHTLALDGYFSKFSLCYDWTLLTHCCTGEWVAHHHNCIVCDDPSCRCCSCRRMIHIVNRCPITRFLGSFSIQLVNWFLPRDAL